MFSRILFDLFLLACVLYFPWWVTVSSAAVGVYIFKNYYEAVFAVFLVDIFYGVSSAGFPRAWLVSSAFLVFYGMSELVIKKNIRYYDAQK